MVNKNICQQKKRKKENHLGVRSQCSSGWALRVPTVLMGGRLGCKLGQGQRYQVEEADDQLINRAIEQSGIDHVCNWTIEQIHDWTIEKLSNYAIEQLSKWANKQLNNCAIEQMIMFAWGHLVMALLLPRQHLTSRWSTLKRGKNDHKAKLSDVK